MEKWGSDDMKERKIGIYNTKLNEEELNKDELIEWNGMEQN